MAEPIRTAEELLERARAGDLEAFGALLAQYRNYARLLARTLIGTTLRLRLDPSDLVQETFLEAHRDFPRFEGATEREVVAWLRRILVRNLADQARRQKAGLRDYRRQESLEAVLERSGAGAAGDGVDGLVAQRGRIAARAGRPPGQRPGRAAARLSRGDHPAQPGAAPVRGGRRADGPVRWRGPHALDPGAGAIERHPGGYPMIPEGRHSLNGVVPPADEGGVEDELAAVLDAYLAEVEAGRPVDPEEWVRRHPAIAGRLRACLRSLHLVEAAAEALAIASGSDGTGPGAVGVREGIAVRVAAGGRARIRAAERGRRGPHRRHRAGRFPGRPRAGARRHGRRLRGGRALAGPSRGAEGPAVRRRHRPPPDRPVPRRGPGRLAPQPPPHRPGLLGRLPGRASTTTPCSSSTGRRSPG